MDEARDWHIEAIVGICTFFLRKQPIAVVRYFVGARKNKKPAQDARTQNSPYGFSYASQGRRELRKLQRGESGSWNAVQELNFFFLFTNAYFYSSP